MPPIPGAIPTARPPNGTRESWTLRGGVFDLSIVPNSPRSRSRLSTQFQWVGEIERRYELWGHPGKIAVTGFLSRGRMGSFEDAIALAAITGGPADIAAVRQYQSRGGVSMNVEQEITPISVPSSAPAGRMATSNPTNSLMSIALWRAASR